MLLILGVQIAWPAAAAPASQDPVADNSSGSRAKARKRSPKAKKSTAQARKRSAARARKGSRARAKKSSKPSVLDVVAADQLAPADVPNAQEVETPPAEAGSAEPVPIASPPSAALQPALVTEPSLLPVAGTSGRAMSEPPVRDAPPAASSSRTRSGPAAHVSLETSGYLDSDHVSVLSPTVSAGLTDDVSGWSVNGHYLVDVVSAASVDIVSTASPHWTEVRHAGGVSGSAAFEPVTLGASAVISREPDYLSITGGGTLSLDLLDKNLTPYLAFSREQDSVGRTDLPHEYWHSKHVNSLQLGLTVVLSRSMIGSIQWDGSFERGYLAKPYRYVPLFAPGQAAEIPAGTSVEEVNRLRLSLRPSEQVPDARDRHALSVHLAHRADASTLRLDERLYADDWGVRALTSELRYIFDVRRRLELWPHLRHHIQGAARFWRRAYEAIPGPDGALGVPVFRTGNRELGPLQIITLGGGVRLGLAEPPGNRWDLVFEFDAGRTSFSDALYVSERFMGYSTLAVEATF
ncbi:MAG TPA: DUF3570 domain-containing protein [Polyangiaceae bacterium]|nr:DUF3570 domain-containing protein [Polyangiaceae bacterium]